MERVPGQYAAGVRCIRVEEHTRETLEARRGERIPMRAHGEEGETRG